MRGEDRAAKRQTSSAQIGERNSTGAGGKLLAFPDTRPQ
jgi:hypothetical protein